jgi:hypothetical protein
MWRDALIVALILCLAAGLYIHFRWQRAPQAYRAMVAIALGCLAAGVMLGASMEHFTAPDDASRSRCPRGSQKSANAA